MFTNTTRLEIQFGDCDPAGIVYYPNYFRFCDNATAALVFGRARHEPSATGSRHYGAAGIPMVDTGAQFIAPSTFGDVVEIRTQITELGRASFSA